MVEKFRMRKKALEAELDAIRKKADEAASKAADRFINDFESLAQNASVEEFDEFMRCREKFVGDTDKLTALIMRSHEHDVCEDDDDDDDNVRRIKAFIIEL